MNVTLIPATAIGAGITGTVYADVSGMLQAGIVATLSGGTSPTGSVSLEVSNDVSLGTAGWAPTNWAPMKGIDGSAVASLSFTDNGSVASQAVSVANQYVRAKWANTSGSGTLTVKMHAIGP